MNAEPQERDDAHGLQPLGSLAQSARLKQLNVARWTLIVIGVITIAVNGYQFVILREEVGKMNDQTRNMGNAQINQAKRREIEGQVSMATIMIGGFVFLGCVFVVLGLLVKTFPVPITIMGLVLYLVGNAATALADPTLVMKGAIIKIFIIIALVKAIQAAMAYQRELNAETYSPDLT